MTYGWGRGPQNCALSPDGRHLWVSALGPPSTNQGGAQLIDTATSQISGVEPGAFVQPTGLSMTPDGRSLLVPDAGTDQAPRRTVTVIDTATSRTSRVITLPCWPVKAAVRPDGREAWVTCEDPKTVWRVPLP